MNYDLTDQFITIEAAKVTIRDRQSSSIVPVTYAADAFVDSVGMNVRLHYDNTWYGTHFPDVLSRLKELGIRHVRDLLVPNPNPLYVERHKELERNGIKGTFIVPMDGDHDDLSAYEQLELEGFEAPNEPNISGDPEWVPKTLDVLEIGMDYAPSLTTWAAHDELGDVSALVEFGNIHNYLDGRHPGTLGWGDFGYGSLDYHFMLANKTTPGLPVVSTETGYAHRDVPEAIIARYLPRLLLEHFRRGIKRTYLYELADSVNPGLFGLLDGAGNKRLSYSSVHVLLHALADPGPAFTVKPLDYDIRQAPDDLRHMAFAKRDGSYVLALWLEQSSYDPNSGALYPMKHVAVELSAKGYSIRKPLVVVSDDLALVEIR